MAGPWGAEIGRRCTLTPHPPPGSTRFEKNFVGGSQLEPLIEVGQITYALHTRRADTGQKGRGHSHKTGRGPLSCVAPGPF